MAVRPNGAASEKLPELVHDPRDRQDRPPRCKWELRSKLSLLSKSQGVRIPCAPEFGHRVLHSDLGENVEVELADKRGGRWQDNLSDPFLI